MVLVWFCNGFAMVLAWSRHGYGMVRHGHGMVLQFFLHFFAEGHVASAIGLLWFLITLNTLLRKLHSKHRQTPGQMFSEHPWYVAVYTNMSSKRQVGPLIFPLGVLITNRTNSDLFPPSVHHPPIPGPCPL